MEYTPSRQSLTRSSKNAQKAKLALDASGSCLCAALLREATKHKETKIKGTTDC